MRIPDRPSLSCLAAVLALAAGFVGCGGSGESEEDEVRAMLEQLFVTSDAEACRELLTERALAQTQFTDPEEALDSCIENSEDADDNADSIEVPALDVSGDRATATVTPKGGSIDGATLELELLNEGGWRVDWIAAMRIDDRERYLEASLADIVEDDTLTAAQGGCVSRWVRAEVSDRELERVYPDKDISFVYDAMRECVGDGTDFGTISAALRQELTREQGLSRGQADCLIAHLRPLIERYRVENFDEVTEDERFRAAAAAAGAICVGPAGPQGVPPADPS